MTDIDRIIEDLEHQLDVLEVAIGTGRLVEPPEPFVPPRAVTPLAGATRVRAEALHARLLAAQEVVAGELERTRRALALTDGEAAGAGATPRFLDTTF